MREACIILPANDPDHVGYIEGIGWPSDAAQKVSDAQKRARSDFVRSLISVFGGVTITEGFGYWADPDGGTCAESVKLYTFACHDQSYARSTFAETTENTIDQLATTVALALAQKAVYVRYPNGDVSIIDLCNKEKAT